MVAKLDGTNGLIQQYDYQTPTTGFSYTFAAGINVLVMQPAGTLATGTITMPASPADGMTITFSSTNTITALTVNANIGQSIVSAPTVLPANQVGVYVYRLSNTTWYPLETVPTNVPVVPAGGSIITSGTAVASTSGTSIDFTSIPSWVKRITIVFNGVSTNGSSMSLIQLGTGTTTYTTSGYVSTSVGAAAGPGTASYTTGFGIRNDDASYVLSGHMVITNISGNIWISSHTTRISTGVCPLGSGSVTLGATLTAVRITSVNGTDTFDAGSINILYE
jgi:hypothetical protein